MPSISVREANVNPNASPPILWRTAQQKACSASVDRGGDDRTCNSFQEELRPNLETWLPQHLLKILHRYSPSVAIAFHDMR
jgi:pantothenate kinase-related protein Tda10